MVPETALGYRHICCGEICLELRSWESLIDTIGRLTEAHGIHRYSCFDCKVYRCVFSLLSFQQAEESMHNAGRLIHLRSFEELRHISTLYTMSGKSQIAVTLCLLDLRTRNPRDRVFALRKFTPWFAKMKVAYDAPSEAVFEEATIALLESARDWSLPFWRLHAASPHLPSWAIDFTHEYMYETNDYDMKDQNGRPVSPLHPQFELFDASASSTARINTVDLHALHPAGFLWDQIETISDYEQVECGSRGLKNWKEVFRRWIRATKVFDHWKRQRGSADSSMEALKRIVVPPTGDIVQLVSDYRLVFTRRRRVGLVPIFAGKGECIAILASGKKPFVLRPVDASYAGQEAHRIIGGCYVDGNYA